MESNVPSIIAFETMFEFCPPVYSLQFIIFLHYLQINIGLKLSFWRYMLQKGNLSSRLYIA